MRILWHGISAFAPSGYGVASHNLIKRLQKAGHDVVLFTLYGLQGGRIEWDNIPHWPPGMQQFGTDVIQGYVKEFQPDVVLTLYDEWVLGSWSDMLGDLWLPWVVVHYDPMEPKLYAATKNTWRQLALCNWGAKMMKDKGMSPRTVPLGVDTKVYQPIVDTLDAKGTIITQNALKKELGVMEDEFLVGMVAANIDFRKNMESQMRVFRDFNKKYPDTHMFIKTNPSMSAGGLPIAEMLNYMGAGMCVSIPERDIADVSSTQMCKWYNSFDIYLGAACSEGFGLPLLEANACGIPVITSDFSAMPEIGKVGWHIPGTMEMNILLSYGIKPDEQKMYLALEEAYNMRGKPEMATMKKAAREHALGYDWDICAKILDKELQDWLLSKEL